MKVKGSWILFVSLVVLGKISVSTVLWFAGLQPLHVARRPQGTALHRTVAGAGCTIHLAAEAPTGSCRPYMPVLLFSFLLFSFRLIASVAHFIHIFALYMWVR